MEFNNSPPCFIGGVIDCMGDDVAGKTEGLKPPLIPTIVFDVTAPP